MNDYRQIEAPVRRIRFSVLFLIPLMAILLSAWLVWEHFAARGPQVTISFETADGLTPGQTQVKNKAVTLGTVRDITLSDDMRRVNVVVQMNASSANFLTDHARFWVVRPQVNGTNITGLDTLISGPYIALDPGKPGGTYQTSFKGLESPPGIRSDQPGSTFWLVSPTLESLGQGALVFFRDLAVGEVLGYTMPPGGKGPILLQVFVKAPYDHYLRTDSRFWNVSGLQVGFGAGGLKVRLQSLQTLFSGGVAFGLPEEDRNSDLSSAPPNSVFKLYATQSDAENARYHRRVYVATYVDTSVSGLAVGSQVSMFGVQIGSVTGVKLQIDDPHRKPRVRIDMELEPGRVMAENSVTSQRSREFLEDFVASGMRVSVQNVSFLTGESGIACVFVRNAKPAKLTYEGSVAIIPSQPGGVDGILQSVSTVANKIAGMPLVQMGDHLDDLLHHTDQRVNSPELTQAMIGLRGSLMALNGLLTNADQHLPALISSVQEALGDARTLLKAYGGDTDFHRNLQGLVVQLSGTARSLRFLSDYLTHHPSALITGRKK